MASVDCIVVLLMLNVGFLMYVKFMTFGFTRSIFEISYIIFEHVLYYTH
jgi:hypothetical protein